MKKPILEVIRFDEADIVTASGLGGLGFTADYFGDGTLKNGKFTFFDRTGSVTSVTTEADHNGVLNAFNSFFGGGWGSTREIGVNGSYNGEGWGSPLEEMIGIERGDQMGDSYEFQKYNGTYYYTFFSDSDGSSYYFRSH